MISERAKQIGESKTLAISAKAREMKSEGIDVISFAAGEPDFSTPENIKKATKKAVDNNFTRYTDVAGIIEFRQAICNKLRKDNNLNYSPERILVSCGGKHSLYNTFQAILNKDDEVIIPSPYWLSYPEQVNLAGGKPVFLETDELFQIDLEKLKNKITRKTKAIIVNSPGNPTGTVYGREELKAIADLAVDKKIFVISDEVYEKVIYEKEHISIASFNDEIKRLTITINGVSKTYSMTGFRIGYAAGEKEIIKAMKKIQSHSTSNPTSIAQIAALEALKGKQEINEWVKEFKKRRNFIVRELRSINKVSCTLPEGAFYVFPNVKKLYTKNINDSISFCNFLLEKARVATVPGIAFGNDEYIRFSYATSMENIKEGMRRIKECLL